MLTGKLVGARLESLSGLKLSGRVARLRRIEAAGLLPALRWLLSYWLLSHGRRIAEIKRLVEALVLAALPTRIVHAA